MWTTVEGEQGSVSCLVLSVEDGFCPVDEGRAERKQDHQSCFEPNGVEAGDPSSGKFCHEQAARGGDERGGGEVGPADQEQRLSLGEASEDEEGSHPCEECQSEEGVVGVEPSAWVPGVDEERGAEECGEAEQVQRRR